RAFRRCLGLNRCSCFLRYPLGQLSWNAPERLLSATSSSTKTKQFKSFTSAALGPISQFCSSVFRLQVGSCSNEAAQKSQSGQNSLFFFFTLRTSGTSLVFRSFIRWKFGATPLFFLFPRC